MAFCRYDSDMVQESPSRGMDKVIVRLPDGMRDRIKAAAEANNRSMNAEIISRLDRSFTVEPEWEQAIASTKELDDRLTRLENSHTALHFQVQGLHAASVKAKSER